MIHVCFGLYDATGLYSKFTGTTMFSLLENTKVPARTITVHILHDDTLTPENRAKFSEVAARFRQIVKFYNVGELCADKLAEYVSLIPKVTTSSVSVGAFYRLLIPKILKPNIGKVIYLDSDLIINLDINELWQIELGDKPVGAVPSYRQSPGHKGIYRVKASQMCLAGLVKPEDYFGSGVLLMNLKVWRKEEKLLMEGIRFRGEHPEYRFFDQEILNYCFSTNYLKLPVKFNRYVKFARSENEPLSEGNIYHYAGRNAGLTLDLEDPFNRLWMDYFIKTPWFNVESIGRFYDSVKQLYIDLKQAMANVTANMSGKTRVFYVTKDNVEMIKQVFSVREDEEIIFASNSAPLKKLVNNIKASDGSKIFIVIVPKFPFRFLTRRGFTPGKDFLDGVEFLSEAQGVLPNFYELIMAM